jgi:hypothetical protein
MGKRAAGDNRNSDGRGSRPRQARKAATAGACKYSEMCRFHSSENHTCGDQLEAESYCGAYGLFDDFRPQASDIGR